MEVVRKIQKWPEDTRKAHRWSDDQDLYAPTLAVSNTSQAAISNLLARYTSPGQGLSWSPPPTEGPASAPAASALTKGGATGSQRDVPVSLVEPEAGFILTSYPRADPDAKRLGGIVRFTDAGKRHWQIDEARALTELEDRNGW